MINDRRIYGHVPDVSEEWGITYKTLPLICEPRLQRSVKGIVRMNRGDQTGFKLNWIYGAKSIS